MVEFNAENHCYIIDGVKTPSVTQIIDAVFPRKDYELADDWYLERGTAVHAWAAKIVGGEKINWGQVQPVIEPRVRALYRWWQEAGITQARAEVVLAGDGYAGTADVIGTYQGSRYVIDWKGTYSPRADWQVAAYCMAANLKRGAVVVVDDVGARVKFVNVARARLEFRAIFATYRAGVVAGLIKEGKE